MQQIDTNSLSKTIDVLNDALFRGESIPHKEKLAAARWIAGRQTAPRSYAGMFAPTEADFANGVRLFTGERVTSGAGTAHIMGEEACRILLKLDTWEPDIQLSFNKATDGMLNTLNSSEAGGYSIGQFCCGTCTPVLWRHLTSGGLDRQEERLSAGLEYLKQHRDGAGKWRRFPFWWTVLALSEISLPQVMDELMYIAPVLERSAKRLRKDSVYSERKRMLADRVLEKI